jgi:protein-disulfide isomerase
VSNKKKARAAREDTRRRGSTVVQQQRAAEKRRTALLQAGIAAVAVLAVLLVTVAVLNSRGAGEPEVFPAGIDRTDGTYTVGDPDAPTTVTVVEDLQCPACRAFEAASGDTLREYAEGDDVKVEYRGVAFLDRASSTEYSSRALNAWACVADEGDQEVWSRFQQAMYEQQPAEGGEGLTDAEITAIAVDAGADEASVAPCIADGTFRDWVAYATEQASDDGVDATPTVYVDGETVSEGVPSPEQLEQAVAEASR